jgi:hypothetical protein
MVLCMHEKSQWGGKVPLDFAKARKIENTYIHSYLSRALLPCTLAPSHLPDKYVFVRGRSIRDTADQSRNPVACALLS